MWKENQVEACDVQNKSKNLSTLFWDNQNSMSPITKCSCISTDSFKVIK